MPGFSKRRINRHTMNILRATGQVIACYQRIVAKPDELATRVPTDPYAANEAPTDVQYTKYFIFGLFEQTVPQEFQAEGKVSDVIGTITIPAMYKSILAKTDYFDPFLNGSKFVKTGAMPDDQGVLIIQSVKAQYIPQLPEVQ